MLIYFRALGESFRFAVNALRNNKTRTFLSLMGVTVGIFSIIGVLAAVDSLEKDIKGSLSSLDSNSMIICHISFGPSEVPRWKRERFPLVTYDDYQNLQRNLPGLGAINYSMNVAAQKVSYEGTVIESVRIDNATEGLYDIERLEFEDGRFFNERESVNGAPVAVIGSILRDNLFGVGVNPVGKQVKTLSRKFTIIGVLKKEGINAFGDSKDEKLVVPVNIIRRIYGDNNRSTFPTITIIPEEGGDPDELYALTEQKMRQGRSIKSGDDSNFFINRLSGFADAIDGIISILTLVGWGIGGFSLLVGGFGIANIMFVSVKERTNLIGIQKALGAKRRFILFQFLFESILLSIFGGLIGLIMVQVVVWLLDVSKIAGDFEFVLSFDNIFLGLFTTFVIGIIAGIVPAIGASKLDPVEAIRTGM
ncbi:ABC transporter permease [Dokdonia donghaensis]|uniref:ABC transporter permease n=2 Tax=Dokdonia TaxID=326319 RepID=A0A0A2GT33_9FLAO|nr:ABC transporter permease [Dokdonia donghaensis]ANH58987.1 Macrolide export ATP-binding/permease protein MacB [Dokdonia donghaensis DSW-1]KGO06419.1 ABC transporter permease [Dokdonia donghaensis DSW-1]